MTSYAPDTMYVDMVARYKRDLERFVGPATTWVSGNTLQLNDYSKTDWEWTYFNPEEEKRRHKEAFPIEKEKVYQISKDIFR